MEFLSSLLDRAGRVRDREKGRGIGVWVAATLLFIAAGCYVGSLDAKGGSLGQRMGKYLEGYLYMANIRCPGDTHGVIDLALQTAFGITGPLFFAAGNDEAITIARQKPEPGCRLVSVIARQPLYKVVYPR